MSRALNPWDPQSERIWTSDGAWHSLSANTGGGKAVTASCWPEISQPLKRRMDGSFSPDMRGGQIVCYSIGCWNSEGMLSPNPKAGIYRTELGRSLDTNGGNPACNQGGIVVVERRDSH